MSTDKLALFRQPPKWTFSVISHTASRRKIAHSLKQKSEVGVERLRCPLHLLSTILCLFPLPYYKKLLPTITPSPELKGRARGLTPFFPDYIQNVPCREFAFIHPCLTQTMRYLSFQLLSLCSTGCLAPFLEMLVRIHFSFRKRLVAKEVLFSKRNTCIMVVASIVETRLLHWCVSLEKSRQS